MLFYSPRWQLSDRIRLRASSSVFSLSAYGFMIHQAEDEAAPQRGLRGIHPSVLPCGLQWLLFGLAIRVYHNLIRSLVRLVGGALMEEGKSVLTCGKLRSQQQSLISMMHLTLLSTSIKVANVLTGAACSFRNTSVLRRVPNRIPLCFKL